MCEKQHSKCCGNKTEGDIGKAEQSKSQINEKAKDFPMETQSPQRVELGSDDENERDPAESHLSMRNRVQQ
jgi:hypothetical protein